MLSHFFGRAGAGKREERRPAALWFKIVHSNPAIDKTGVCRGAELGGSNRLMASGPAHRLLSATGQRNGFDRG